MPQIWFVTKFRLLGFVLRIKHYLGNPRCQFFLSNRSHQTVTVIFWVLFWFQNNSDYSSDSRMK